MDNKANYTHDMVKKTMKCNISVISEKADFEKSDEIVLLNGSSRS